MLIDQTKGNVSLFCIVISKIVIDGTCAESNNLEVFPQVVVQVWFFLRIMKYTMYVLSSSLKLILYAQYLPGRLLTCMTSLRAEVYRLQKASK